ncbi:MAG: GNAT family N-acetyltransferase [Lachnospiraceae bacterium]|nr:GNAT family N-acetyltransferase [Lachnospiraceae bacterium]
MKERIVDPQITLVPYYPNEEITLRWYQDKDVCKQVDNRDDIYTIETLQAMYSYLSTHGDCYYIQYRGVLVGDITLRDNGEISIVICREYQNRHIGRRCIKAMVDIAREKGFVKVKANIYSFNAQSQKVFMSAGFQQTAKEWYELAI